MAKVNVITLSQPWAQLVVSGAKGNETRGWKPSQEVWERICSCGRDLYIHAAKKFQINYPEYFKNERHFKKFIVSNSTLITGAIIGKVRLCGFKSTNDKEFLRSLTAQEKAFGDYNPNRWAWPLEEPEIFDHPINVDGKLSVWEYEMGSHCTGCGIISDRLLIESSRAGNKLIKGVDKLCPQCTHKVGLKTLSEIYEERKEADYV